MTTPGYPAPLAGHRDWRIPLLRRLVVGLGWAVFAAGVAAGTAGVVLGIPFAWVVPAGAAVVALFTVMVAPEPRPVRRPRSIPLGTGFNLLTASHPAASGVPAARNAPQHVLLAAYEAHTPNRKTRHTA